ncbi:MAG: hypothetical protein ACLSVD_02245 [Eggerthellaceae bacterium]
MEPFGEFPTCPPTGCRDVPAGEESPCTHVSHRRVVSRRATGMVLVDMIAHRLQVLHDGLPYGGAAEQSAARR